MWAGSFRTVHWILIALPAAAVDGAWVMTTDRSANARGMTEIVPAADATLSPVSGNSYTLLPASVLTRTWYAPDRPDGRPPVQLP